MMLMTLSVGLCSASLLHTRPRYATSQAQPNREGMAHVGALALLAARNSKQP